MNNRSGDTPDQVNRGITGLGQSLEDIRANHPGVEWTRVDSLEGIGEGVELYASELILIGFLENQLISVSALAYLPGDGGTQ